ncbi:MAG: hypothetical protein HY904_19450 [Deltaproteobacteria bacterium]|nr:hypothetical protein [Deltaproteobacteria bacterium]
MPLRFIAWPALLLAPAVALAAPAREKPREKTTAPAAPTGQKREGPSGQAPRDGACADTQVLARRGAVLRLGPAEAFGVHRVVRTDRCLPRVRTAEGSGWILVETEQGKAGWLDPRARPLALGDPPAIPAGPTRYSVTSPGGALAHAEPSLLAAITDDVMAGDTLEVKAVSEDGLFLLCTRDGEPLGWVLKLVVRDPADAEPRPGGSRPWAPPPAAPEFIPEGSPDFATHAPPEVAVPPPPRAPEAPAPAITPPAGRPPPRRIPGILDGRPIGRGLVLGVGANSWYFLQRFQSNAFNDPLGNYRLDVVTAALSLDAEYHAPFGLIVGGRLNGHLFSYTDYVPPALARLPEPIGNPSLNGRTRPDLGCPFRLPGVLREICPIPSTWQTVHLYAGWRLYSAEDLDLSLRVGYTGELLVFGKPTTREPFADLWYHGIRPTVRLVWRPWQGRFGALATDAALGAGFVVPMVLRRNRSTPVPQPQDILEQTYTLQDGKMVRSGYARPPNYIGMELRPAYLFELPFFQVELGVQLAVHYYAVFYTAREGFARRNRCCDRGYYDRASNLDVLFGPSVTTRLAL